VKAVISAAAMTALQILAAGQTLKIDQHVVDMLIVSSDANSHLLKLGFNKAVTIDLSADVKEILVADPVTVSVIPRTKRRVYITGAALGKTNIFFYNDDGQQIAALDVWVSDAAQPRQADFGVSPDRQQRKEPAFLQFLKGSILLDR
jgi:Flp pilus assembly secretin CpaC